MTQKLLYQECPRCDQGSVVWQDDETIYRCENCDLTLRERSFLGLFKKGNFEIIDFGQGDFRLAEQSLKDVTLALDPLKVVIGNIYTDQQLAEIAAGVSDLIRPVKTILAQIILEQLNEVCHLQVNGLRRGHGQAIEAGGNYQPVQLVPKQGIRWLDQGNLFCTDQRLVFPSNSFTFMRMDRKMIGIQAFNDGLAVQRKGEDFATYFVGCYPHEAALAAAYVMGKLPALRTVQSEMVEKG